MKPETATLLERIRREDQIELARLETVLLPQRIGMAVAARMLGDEVSWYLLERLEGVQNITTHAIAVTGASSDGNYPNFIRWIAKRRSHPPSARRHWMWMGTGMWISFWRRISSAPRSKPPAMTGESHRSFWETGKADSTSSPPGKVVSPWWATRSP